MLTCRGEMQIGEAHPDGGNPVVSVEQFEEFQRGWACIQSLLHRIGHVWNSEDPFIVCGFEIDHYHAVGALRQQPAGTFLCRFSLSQPGNMVLVCKVRVYSPCAGSKAQFCNAHGT